MLIIPRAVVISITTCITKNYPTLTEKTTKRLFEQLCHLWYIVADRQDFHNKCKSTDWEPVQIPRKYLQKITVTIGKRQLQYTDLMQLLIDAGLIIRNDSYSNSDNPFSKSYSCTTQNWSDLQFIDCNVKRFIANYPTKDELIKQWPMCKKQIQNLFLTEVNLPELNKWLVESTISSKKHWSILRTAIKINLNCYFFMQANTGRNYSSIASLPKAILPFLKISGRECVELDIANCQPTLLASQINHADFKQACIENKFYTVMADELGITGPDARNLTKDQCWRAFFSNGWTRGNLKKAFDQAYPGLLKEMNRFKCKSKNEFRKRLWFVLQSLEADIVMTTISKFDYPLATRHDSILCWPENAEQIKAELIKQFELKTGITPQIKIK